MNMCFPEKKDLVFPSKLNCGFSLVELMVALLIGLVIVLGAGQLYITSKKTYDHVGLMSERQQSLRALFDFMTLDIRTAATVEDTPGGLILTYSGSRDLDPYCGGSDSLSAVEYLFNEEKGAVEISVECGAGKSSFEALVTGVVGFSSIPSLEGFYVEVEVALSAFPDEAEENSRFTFIVARRSVILNT